MKLYLLITAIIGLGIAMLIIWLIRKDHLHVKYAFGWVIIGILSAILGFAPQAVDLIAKYLDIGYPPILAIVLAISFILIKLLIIDIDRSKTTRDIVRLNQRIGILEANIHQISIEQEKTPKHAK